MDKEVKSLIRAVIVACKGGVPLDDINDEFHRQTGYDIPYLRLGYTSLQDLFRTFRSVKTERNHNGVLVYKVVELGRMKHIDDLVKKQRDPVIRHNHEKKKERLAQRPYERQPDNVTKSNPAYYNPISETEDSAYDSTVYDDDNRSPVRIEAPPRDLSHIHEPLMNGQQLIGDDFFLQLAIRNLRRPIWRKAPCSALHCGLCISGLTIRGFMNILGGIKSLSNKIVILIGAEDIYRGRTFDELRWDFEDMVSLLHSRFAFSRDAIRLCTIPPLANLGVYSDGNKLQVLRGFNNHLRYFASTNHYGLVDFYTHMTNVNLDTEWDMFQLDARMVSGSNHPYVLWNKRGRCLAVNLLARQVNADDNDY